MPTKPSIQSRRIAFALLAIAVTTALHGTWLSDLDVTQRTPRAAAIA